MATYLQIFKDTVRECGITTVPSTAIGQSGELARISAWIPDAYTEIQGARHWRWLRKKFNVNTVDGTDTYAFGDCTDIDDAALITRFKTWRLDDRANPPKVFLLSAGVGSEIFLTWTKWDYFEYLYKTGSLQNQTSFPVHITVNPKDEIQLGITPNDIYTLTGDYHKSAQILVADTDIPEMPTDYHSLIKYQAMIWYAESESASEVLMRGQIGYGRIMRQLIRNQGSPFRVGGPMA